MKVLRSLALAAASGAVLSACVHYEPRPVAPERFTAHYDAARMDPEPAGGVWDNAALLTTAIAHSTAVREAEANYRSARAAALASRAPPPISLTLVAEYSRDAGGTTPWLVSGLLGIPLDVGAKRDSRLKTADLAAIQALYDYAEAIWTVRSELVHARILRLAAEREAVLAQQAVQLRQDRAQKLEARIRAGEDGRPVGVLAAVDLAAAQRRVQDLINQRVQADAALSKALGVGITAIQPIRMAPLPDTITVPANADLVVWRQEAALRRRDVLRAVADYSVAEEAVRLEVAKQYPDVALGPGYTFERGQHKIPFDLTLTLPPRDLNKANIKAAEAKRVQAAARLDSAQATVLNAVDTASTGLIAAKAGLDRSLNQDLPLARLTDDAARKAFAAGELDRTDQEAAQASAVDAQIAAIEAWKSAWTAVADLEDALRQPSPVETAALEAAIKRAGDAQ